MVVENLATYKVKNYKQAFKMYKRGLFGVVEQRMPDNLVALKPSNKLSELECIQSLLETDNEMAYHIYFDGKEYIITAIGFNISKIIDGKKQLIQIGEDGVFQEEAEYVGITDPKDESNLEWQDSSNGTFEMWGMCNIKKHKKISLKKLLKKSTFFIENGEKLEEFRDILNKKGYDVLMGYDDTYLKDKSVSSGYIHFDGGFYISKNTFEKEIIRNISTLYETE